LQGYSYGAISSLFAVDPKTPGTHDSNIVGPIPYYPYCYDNVDPSVPKLAVIGEKDDWTPAALCQKVNGKPNFEVAAFLRTPTTGSARQWENWSTTWGPHRLQRKGNA
jgi:dienelactone hydrolase